MPEIWMFNHYAITPDMPGGTRHYDLGCELTKLGCHVKIFASDVNLASREHTRIKNNDRFCFENLNGVDYVWVRTSIYRKNDWRRLWNMISYAVNICRMPTIRGSKPNVIIGSSPHPFAALVAVRMARKYKAKFFLELRDLWPQALIDMGGLKESNPIIRMMRIFESYLYHRAEKIIVLAEGATDYLINRWGVTPEKVVYLPNGVHMDNFRCNQEIDALRLRYGFKKFTLIYTGAHGPANSLETILKAADRLKCNSNVEFVLVGDGPTKEELIAQASNMNLKNVRFMSPVPKTEIPDLLAAANACIITLKDADAFSYAISPNKLFDYMASQKPVICAVRGEMGDLVKKSGAGISIPPEDDKSLADAVMQLISTPEYNLKSMGINGFNLVAQNYSRQLLAKKLIQMLI